MSVEENRRNHRAWMEANDRHDLSEYERFMHEDIEIQQPDGFVKGIDAVRRGMEDNLRAMPDYHVQLDDQVATEDRVICRWRVSGTPVATGVPIEVTGCSYWEYEDGRARRGWAYTAGPAGLKEQIGAR
jgi:predicted ester cyclase